MVLSRMKSASKLTGSCPFRCLLAFLLLLQLAPLTLASGTRPAVTITTEQLIKNQTNTIEATVTDPDGDANPASVYISVRSPSTISWDEAQVYQKPMSCSGTGSSLSCTFSINVDSSWASDAKIAVVAADSVDWGEYAVKTVPVLSGQTQGTRPAVTITTEQLIKNQTNTIEATVTDPDGDANSAKVYIYVISPANAGWDNESAQKVWEKTMSCSGDGYTLNCSYEVAVDDTWATDANIAIIAADSVGYGSYSFKSVSVISGPTPSPSPSPQTPTPSQSPTSPSPTPSPSPQTPSPSPQTPTPSPSPSPQTPTPSPSPSPSPTSPTPPSPQTPTPTQSNLEITLDYPKPGENILPESQIRFIRIKVSLNGKPLEEDALSALLTINDRTERVLFIRQSGNIYQYTLEEPLPEGNYSIKIMLSALGTQGSIATDFSFRPEGGFAWIINLLTILMVALLVAFFAYIAIKKYSETEKPAKSPKKPSIPPAEPAKSETELITVKKFGDAIEALKALESTKLKLKSAKEDLKKRKAREIIKSLKEKLK
ncbi:MAG: hypothetical protein J7L44_00375 [Candidatus Diapherotrites archaeon]|nr:hypothetical protein [Candidatus Diapherotrites archaeon]